MMYPLSFYFCSGSVSTSDSCVFLDGGDSFGENLAFGEMARWWLLQLGLVINTVVALVVDGIKCKQGGREGGKVCTIDLVWVLLCPLLIFLHSPRVKRKRWNFRTHILNQHSDEVFLKHLLSRIVQKVTKQDRVGDLLVNRVSLSPIKSRSTFTLSVVSFSFCKRPSSLQGRLLFGARLESIKTTRTSCKLGGFE